MSKLHCGQCFQGVSGRSSRVHELDNSVNALDRPCQLRAVHKHTFCLSVVYHPENMAAPVSLTSKETYLSDIFGSLSSCRTMVAIISIGVPFLFGLPVYAQSRQRPRLLLKTDKPLPAGLFSQARDLVPAEAPDLVRTAKVRSRYFV
jgi:hypothetical protein